MASGGDGDGSLKWPLAMVSRESLWGDRTPIEAWCYRDTFLTREKGLHRLDGDGRAATLVVPLRGEPVDFYDINTEDEFDCYDFCRSLCHSEEDEFWKMCRGLHCTNGRQDCDPENLVCSKQP